MEMPAVTARSVPEVSAEAAPRAVAAMSPAAAEEEAVITVAAAAARVARPTAVMFPMAAEEAAARRTLSRAPPTCICGKGGKIQPITGWSSSVGSQKNPATSTNGFANREAILL